MSNYPGPPPPFEANMFLPQWPPPPSPSLQQQSNQMSQGNQMSQTNANNNGPYAADAYNPSGASNSGYHPSFHHTQANNHANYAMHSHQPNYPNAIMTYAPPRHALHRPPPPVAQPQPPSFMFNPQFPQQHLPQYASAPSPAAFPPFSLNNAPNGLPQHTPPFLSGVSTIPPTPVESPEKAQDEEMVDGMDQDTSMDREEGELSDGEGDSEGYVPSVDHTNVVSQLPGLGMTQPMSIAQARSKMIGGISTGISQPSLPPFQLPGLNSQKPVHDATLNESRNSTAYVTRGPQHSIAESSDSSYDPPPADGSDPEQTAVTNNYEPTIQDEEHLSDTSRSSVLSKKIPGLREDARRAILRLWPHKIGYQDLVDEGIEASVLKNLYESVGIPTTMPASPKQMTSPATRPTDVSLGAEPRATSSSDAVSQSKAVSERAQTAQAAAVPNGDSKKTAPQQVTSKKSGPVETATTKKPVDRAEYIRMMLAAKASKAKPAPPKVKEATVTTPAVQPEVVTEVAAPATEAVSTPVATAILTSGDVSTPRSSSQPTTQLPRDKMRSQAQLTELARRKIEELKQEQANKKKAQEALLVQQKSSIVPALSELPIVPSAAATPLPTAVKPNHDTLPINPSPLGAAGIPGLFMTSVPTAPGPSLTTSDSHDADSSSDQQSTMLRKRPRASDFIDGPATRRSSSYSQRTGSSQDQDRVIIDLSEDESGSDDEFQAGDTGPQASAFLENLAAGSGLPARPPMPRSISSFNGRPSSAMTDPASSQELKQRDEAILAMRRKIAALEERRLAKVASGGTPTPASRTPDVVHLSLPKLPPSKDVEMTTLVGASDTAATIRETPVQAQSSPLPVSTLFSTTIPSAESLTRSLQRRKEIEDGLPVLDAEVSRLQQQLEQARRDAEQLEEELRKGIEGKLALTAELETLKAATDVSSSQDEQRLENGHSESHSVAVFDAHSRNAVGLVSDSHEESDFETSQDNSEPHNRNTNEATTPQAESLVANETIAEQAVPEIETAISPNEGAGIGGETLSLDNQAEGVPLPAELDYTPMELDEPLNHNVEDDIDHASIASLSMDEGTPHRLSEAALSDEGIDSQNYAESDEGSGYDPEEPQTASILDDVSEASDYEPPDADASETSAVEASDGSEPPFSPASASPVPGTLTAEHEFQILDDVSEDGSQRVLPASANRDMQPTESTDVRKGFRPYESALKIFKGYRNHPNFLSEVGDGYRSLRYSNNIDPNKQMCMYETAGGSCNDSHCPYQHFRDVQLSDDKIILQMGTAQNGLTPEQLHAWDAGLGQLVADLRTRGVNDLDTVAAEFAAYRRRFAGDPSRILPL